MKYITKMNTISKSGKVQLKPINSAPTPSKNMSVNVRKIENGYLVQHSGMKGKKYVEKTHYSATNPIQINSKVKFNINK